MPFASLGFPPLSTARDDAPSGPLKRTPSLTLYTRIREELRERIERGIWQPHDRVPSESELMKQYAVSRITVRQALGDLEKERVIFKVPGKGSFVAEPPPLPASSRLVRRPLEEARLHGGDGDVVPAHELLSIREVAAPEAVADRLGLARGDRVTEVRRLGRLQQGPVSFHVHRLACHLGRRLAHAGLAAHPVQDLLPCACGIASGHVDLVIDAAPAEEEPAVVLGVPLGSPVLHIQRITHARGGPAVLHEDMYCRPGALPCHLRLR